MSDMAAQREPARLSWFRAHGAVLWTFAGTMFLSALLLFSVQPIFAKLVLPTLGGSPSVWAVSMVFFQAVLLAGYCYAHAVNRFLAPRHASLAHLLLTALAFLALPFGLPAGAEPPAGDAYLWLIAVLGLGVGLPFFAVSANAPLLQSWFARSGHPHAADPYFLYGASNLGSLMALLAYPMAIEPWIGLSLQARVWTAGFVLLGLAIAACALQTAATDKGGATARASLDAEQGVRWEQRLVWIGLSFVPSGLLVAFSTYVTTDIASAPFLWVIPLALFLATFILVFRDVPAIPHQWMLLSQPVLVALVLLGLAMPGNRGWIIGVAGGFGAFFVTTMVCHRELYERRPAAQHLTEFYLWMSLGGVLGGVFAALIAPQAFNALYEFPLLLVLGMACRSGIIEGWRNTEEREEATLFGVVAVGVVLALGVGVWAGSLPQILTGKGVLILIMAGAAIMLIAYRFPLRQLFFAVATGLGLVILPSAMNQGLSERSFFGVHRIVETKDGVARLLMHGTTVHGSQRLRLDDGRPVTAASPATYYYPGSPMARGVDAARFNLGNRPYPLNAGMVGLGAGSMACHSRPYENWRFFEIDPVVVKIARDPKHFDFIARCRPNIDVVLGDARLTLAKEPAGRFDYLVVDAFSSDSVPVHLLTKEALQLYLDKVSENGLVALHISNRHMALEGVTAALAGAIPGLYAALVDDLTEATADKSSSLVMFYAKSPSALAPVLEWRDAKRVTGGDMAVWTDDYSNILAAIVRHYWK